MFDLKKRSSVNLSGEFRRVAVRRKAGGPAGGRWDSGDQGSSACTHRKGVRSGVSGSCGATWGFNADCGVGEVKYGQSSAKGSPLKPQVPPKPDHLRSPGESVGFSRQTRQRPTHAGGAGSGSPSPGKRGIRGCSPLRDGGHSPAKLSQRNHGPLMGKLRTLSPAQARGGGCTSWLGLQGAPGDWADRRDRGVGKSLSVPDLVVHVAESRIPSENVEPVEPASSTGSAGAGRAPAVHGATETSHPSDCGGELSPLQTAGVAPGEDLQEDQSDGEGDTPTRPSSRFSCMWTKVPPGEDLVHETPGCLQDEKSEKGGGGGGERQDEGTWEQRLFRIASELLQTERAYVARLHLLDQVFCCRLAEEAGRGSFPPELLRSIFSNVSSIHCFHSQFLLPDLETCIVRWAEGPGLGAVLLRHAPFLRMYADYVRNFDRAVELVRTWTERCSAFRGVVQDVQAQAACGSLSLQHHMLEPVQRVPRYQMLLRDYLKTLPEGNPDHQPAQESLQIISMAATHSNSAIHRNESLKRLLEIYEMVGDEEVVNPASRFLREGRLLKLAARNASATERHVFLFNGFLLCCSPRFSLVGQRLAVRCRIGVEGMQVHQTANEDHPFTFQVSGKERTLELQASSEHDRDQWIKVIQEAIDEFQKKNETFRSASKELSVETQSGELGRRAPRWIRDHEVNLCMACTEPFNALTRRRHHCRACGSVVCWRCSDNKAALEYDGNKLNKVCRDCYSVLTGPRGDGGRTLEPEAPPVSGDRLISSFLRYGGDPATCQRLWSVLLRTEAPVLHLYALPTDVKPLLSVRLPGARVDSSPPDLLGRPSFCLIQSRTSHVLSCETEDLKRSWLAALAAACSASASPDGESRS
ncbi:FYVE, RhoGEF and PH domain-containing protein 4-like [Salarias fasciatus]|uniref:FYVE, RhoGEF and PH domain-containing protein 4-like n=1 Tax=Salarias fasciatus TaxID=181472 RepID=UPI00117693EB|nr:FYVE, RhoGEF and PH domain-containing protein 4-like [Salarias fasciatus]